MNTTYIAYLHACGVSHLELTEIFEDKKDSKGFYKSLSDRILEKYVKNIERRGKILENYAKLKTHYIDEVIVRLWVDIIILHDTRYPESLKNIPHAPFLLYVRGEIPTWDMFWVVGSRKITEYGKKVIAKVVPDISKIFPIVSGWAAWCDSEAHKITLKSWAKTIVVVGTWIDQTYPVSNERLFDEVVEKWWAIVSIFRIWEPGNPYNFPVRNEIVVWLSRWILVVEAKEKSGSLITANLALDLWKDLFSVPWEITSQSSGGTNMLIKKWEAKCVTSSMDILEEYNILIKQSAHKNQLPLLDAMETEIYKHISETDKSIDELVEILWITSSAIGIKISMLELKNIIKKSLSGKYTLV